MRNENNSFLYVTCHYILLKAGAIKLCFSNSESYQGGIMYIVAEIVNVRVCYKKIERRFRRIMRPALIEFVSKQLRPI